MVEPKIFVIIDETGDKKKGRSTDYVSRQYLGKFGKIDNGIVAVTAWELIDNITFLLMFAIYKPKLRLKAGDIYSSQPEIATRLVEQFHPMRFPIELVLADNLYNQNETTLLGSP